MSTARTVEIYADIWCPFAHVGLRAAVATRSLQGREDVPLLIHSWPLELVNGSPMDPIVTAAHVRELREQVAPDLFKGFDQRNFPSTTMPALALAELAYRRSLPTGEAVSLALRDALFEEGQDISRPTLLKEIADLHGVDTSGGFDESLVRGSWRAGRVRGVEGSPHFFCSQGDAFCPSLDIERDPEGHLILQRNAARLEVFLIGCFDT